MQDLQNEKTQFNTVCIIWTIIITIFLCWGWFSWADAAPASCADKCAALADISEYAVWECHGASCLADCNKINPDIPEYCAHVCK